MSRPSRETSKLGADQIGARRHHASLVRIAAAVRRLSGELNGGFGTQSVHCPSRPVTPAREWPDMVVVANTGTINYASQFPGDREFGLFLPPAKGALANYTPPMYLAIFSPGAKVPNFSHILEVVPQTAVVVSG